MDEQKKTQNKAILEVAGVGKTFATNQGQLTILEQVSFSVNAGETVAIIGPSGSGKSTLLSLIGLLDTPTTGTITIAGVTTNTLSENAQAAFRSKNIGFIFQSFELISPFSVEENVAAPLEIAHQTFANGEVDTLLTQIGLGERKVALPYTLSGGEKQRVAIARALVHKPAIILADEPTGSLDRATGERVLNMLLGAVKERGTTLVIITHDESIALRMDRVFEIKNRTVHERL
jgi:putative ABC transport system ATP-binding protein